MEETSKKMVDEKEYRLLMDTAILAGEIMISSGAETYRVEDTTGRILRKSNFDCAESFVLPTGLTLTLSDENISALSITKRVSSRSTNLNRIDQVNTISRLYCMNQITLEEAYHKLTIIKKLTQYPIWLRSIGIILATTFFTVLIGGQFLDCVVAFVAGIVLAPIYYYGPKIIHNDFMLTLIGALISSFFAILTTFLLNLMTTQSISTDLAIIGTMMPLVPGVAITNAVRDTLYGDYMAGSTRLMEAILIATAVALGVGLSLIIGNAIFGGLGL